MSRSYRTIITLLLLLAGPGIVSAQAADELAPDLQTRTGAGTRLAIFSSLSPLAINQIHSWRLQLSDARGEPVQAEHIEVIGGMPDHDHGLPTAPLVTATETPGEYLLQGLRFHMPGPWLMEFTIHTSQGSEQARLEFSL